MGRAATGHGVGHVHAPVVLSVLFLLIPILAPLHTEGQPAEDDTTRLRQELDRLTDLLAGPSLAERGARWRCTPSRGFHCSPDGCQEIPATVWLELDFRAPEYRRCDAKGCDSHVMEWRGASAYTTVLIPRASGSFLKATNDGREFTDVASLRTGVFVYFGRCAPGE